LTVLLSADARDDHDGPGPLLARRLTDKREAAPNRRPRQVRRVIGGSYEQPCLPAVDGNHKDLLRPLDAGVGLCGPAVGQKGDPPAIWRPSRKGVTVLSGRELPQGTAIHRHDPQV